MGISCSLPFISSDTIYDYDILAKCHNSLIMVNTIYYTKWQNYIIIDDVRSQTIQILCENNFFFKKTNVWKIQTIWVIDPN